MPDLLTIHIVVYTYYFGKLVYTKSCQKGTPSSATFMILLLGGILPYGDYEVLKRLDSASYKDSEHVPHSPLGHFIYFL